MADAVDAMIAEGEESIAALPARAQHLAETIASNYPAVTLAAVAAEFGKLPTDAAGKSALNSKVTSLSALVREEVAVACSEFRRAEMWIRLKTPAVADGNNFGVEVQHLILTELQNMRTGSHNR